MNIAYLTSEYKDLSLGNEDTSTYISNSFCRKWKEQGHNVVVIHNASRFPKIIYFVPKFVKRIFESKIGFTWGGYDSVKKKQYEDKGVCVYRLPICKIIPHRSPSNRRLDEHVEKIKVFFNESNFVPDVIIGQWASPQMELIYRLKDTFNCKTAVVLHGEGYVNLEKFPTKTYLQKIDKLGARSKTSSDNIQKLLCLNETPFVCYSGIPDEYLRDYKCDVAKFSNIRKWKFAFAGRLVELKKVDVLIRSLNHIKEVEWELHILGEGAQLSELQRLCRELNCENSVIFHGKVDRKEVMNVLSECHCFIMVSVGEVFGLAYLEAMGACCITVGSVGGGIDGVIHNNENGFLVPAGNEEQLTVLLRRMINLEPDEMKQIARAGYNTAVEFSETRVAERYLDAVTSGNKM